MRDRIMTMAARGIGALLCVGIIIVHVDDQGGLTAFADPDWIGWSYRLVEVVALLVGLALLSGWRPRWGWSAAFLVAGGPFLAYLLTRTVGLPQDSDDIGNWADPVGTASLIIEGALIMLSLAMVWVSSRADRVVPARRRSPQGAGSAPA